MTDSSSVRAHSRCRERAEASTSCAVLGRVSEREKGGGKRNPYQTAPTPSRSPGPEKEEKNLIQLWDAVDRQSTNI